MSNLSRYQQNKQYFAAKQREYYNRHKIKIQQKQKINWNKNKEILISLGLLTDCIICGFSKEKSAAIAFHHKDPLEKEYLICKLLWTADRQTLISEAKKCVCMCFNCHQLYHNEDEKVIRIYNQKLIEITNNKGRQLKLEIEGNANGVEYNECSSK